MTKAARTGVAIVTGAAAGMGEASAKLLAVQGWPLILCDLNGERLEQAASSLRASGQMVETVAGDISAPEFVGSLLTMLGDRLIGAVIHAAGLSPSRGDAARIMAVNYDATARLVEAILPRMAEGGCAVLISSSSGYYMSAPHYDAALKAIGPGGDSSSLLEIAPEAGPAYALSKRGVTRMVEQQAMAFGERGARIVSIAPGLIDTEMGRDEQRGSAQMEHMLQKTPLGRFGTAEEIASVAVFLCSPEASYITGSEIKVDGGTLATALS